MPNSMIEIHTDAVGKRVKIAVMQGGREVNGITFDAAGSADFAQKFNGACHQIGVTPSALILPGDARWALDGLGGR